MEKNTRRSWLALCSVWFGNYYPFVIKNIYARHIVYTFARYSRKRLTLSSLSFQETAKNKRTLTVR